MVSEETCRQVVRGMKELLQTVVIAFKSKKESSQINKIEPWIVSLHLKIMAINLTTYTISHVSKGVQLYQRDNDYKKNFQEVKRIGNPGTRIKLF